MGILRNLGIKTPLSKVPLEILIRKLIDPKNNRKMMLSRCSICNNKKSTFVLRGSGWLDSLGLNTPQNRMKNALWNAFNR